MKENIENNSLHLVHSLNCLIALSLFIVSCNSQNERTIKKVKISHIQSYIDSCSNLYLEAINDVKRGYSKDEVKAKYANNIIKYHSKFSQSFDSITSVYMNKKISEKEYDNIMRSLVLDSVSRRSEELSKLGVEIELR